MTSIWDDPYQMPTDPLLGSDAFIAVDADADADADVNQTEQLQPPTQPLEQEQNRHPVPETTMAPPPGPVSGTGATENPIAIPAKPVSQVPPTTDTKRIDPLLGFDAFIAAGGGTYETEKPDGAAEPQIPVDGSSEAKPARRSRKGADSMERPDWLPESWEMICRTRASGASAGITDRYYVEPKSHRRFRSKNEVLHFLETGNPLKRKLNADSNDMTSDTPGKDKEKSGTKSRKSGTKKKKEAPWTFDFQNPPEEVSWSLVDDDQGLWEPSIADERVPDKTIKEWTTTFKRVSEMANNYK